VFQAGATADHLPLFSVSAFAKVGSTTPLSVPIFVNYVDVLRSDPVKYIYLQSNQQIRVSQNYSAVPAPAPTAAEIQMASIDST